ncbi:amidohydrolase [Flavobacterium akiainvivens]|uniref:Amidohydrolase n=1 Tax=Flavobacterium akiainvivens TaxID=1202724 RepID=A0A0M9VGR9_9FLAO|nr:carbon-nitrogen hydrolase family protein [Flavobacterium akiainvivens]KOS04750.1 amidohydrolase [Flavobacterium akiainvivens]SFQ66713.1 Predicted amidohydrolase [Flavobacterium akiainvivens]
MKIAVASPSIPHSLKDGLIELEKHVKQAAAQGVKIICFPESFLPGYPGMPYTSEDRTKERLEAALEKVCAVAAENNITVIVPMDWHENGQLLNVAFVVSANGKVLGYQAKTQLDPSEDAIWVPGTKRRVFEIDGLIFGISICHEGFRYPETVRFAVRNGAQVVFHPFFAGSDTEGVELTEYGAKTNPYYEKAQMVRALENTVYIATSNYASRYSEAASAIIAASGQCIAHAAYGEPGITVADIDLELATGFLAGRYKPESY